MTARPAVMGIATLAVASALALSTPVFAAEPPVASPPPPGSLTEATNAMLQPRDVSGALADGEPALWDRSFRTGFNAPPGGQDPLPVCAYGAEYATQMIPGQRAVGYNSVFRTMNHDVYQYSSARDARKVWDSLTSQVRSNCAGTFMRGQSSTTISTSKVAGVPGGPSGLGVLSNGASAQYSVLHLVGDSIQMLTYAINDGPIASKATKAANALSATLATRWLGRSTLPVNQDPLLTKAESAMLAASEVPASLPVTTPRRGGWSGFSSYSPGTSPFICNARVDIPAGTASLTSSYGGSGGPLAIPGTIYQQVYVYPSTAAAREAWSKLTAGVRTCNDKKRVPLTSTEPVNRSESGISTLTVGGVPGVWSRNLNTSPPEFTTKSYTIHLLVGDAIQLLTYSTGTNGVGNVPLDQAAVNALAESLAERWAR